MCVCYILFDSRKWCKCNINWIKFFGYVQVVYRNFNWVSTSVYGGIHANLVEGV